MSKRALRERSNWQTASGSKAQTTENRFYDVFEKAFIGTEYVFHVKPNHLKNIYATVRLSDDIISQIYNPPFDVATKDWGVAPDFAVENTMTGKIIFGEIKRQDGWVEGKDPSAGRGNAHERLCKLFTPGLLSEYRKHGKIGVDQLPFWVIFEGDITRDPKRVREITLWFSGYQDHFFMWRDPSNVEKLLEHFHKKIKPKLQ